jgi:predicted ATP-binding protein involved in virulence
MKFEQPPTKEKYAKEYEKSKARLLDIFRNKDGYEIKELCSGIRRFASIIDWDTEDAENVIGKIEESYNQENPEAFVNTSFAAIKKLIDQKINHPEVFERARRETIMQHHGNIRLSELMYYNVDLENGTAKIHIAPKGDLKLGAIIKSFRDGLKELARQVKEDERIKEIQATSWIVASNPGLLEKAGFTVEGTIDEKMKTEHFQDEKGPVSRARMSRETLLEKYLN